MEAATRLGPDSDYVLRSAKERGVRFVRLWFVDVLGVLKSIAIPVSELESRWRTESGSTAPPSKVLSAATSAISSQCPTRRPSRSSRGDRSPMSHACSAACSRPTVSLPRATPALRCDAHCVRAADLGYQFQVGAEVEFFLFEAPDDGDPGAMPVALDDGAYFDLTPLDAGSDFRRAAIEHLEQMGIPVTPHHEAAPSQHEVDLEHTDALSMADAITTFRLVVKEVARDGGVYATFMPKPLTGDSARVCICICRCSVTERTCSMARRPSIRSPISDGRSWPGCWRTRAR